MFPRSRFALFAAVAVMVAASAVPVNAAVITFDDIATNNSITSVPLGYQGFNWGVSGGFYAVSQNYSPSQGWVDGVVSAPKTRSSTRRGRPIALFLPTAGSSFVFNSAYFASPGYVGGSPVTVTGFLRHGAQVGSVSFDTTTTPVLKTFNWTVDTVTFTDTYYEVFEMDNVTINGGSIPEPCTLIVGLPLGGLGVVVAGWRKWRAA